MAVGAMRRARVVVLALLALSVIGSLWLAGSRLAPDGVLAAVALIVIVAAHGVIQLVAQRAAVSTDADSRRRDWSGAALVAVTLAAWVPFFVWAERDEEPWSWLAGFAVGTVVLVVRAWIATAVLAAFFGLAAAGALIWHGQLAQTLIFFAVGAVATSIMTLVVVWMLRLALAAEAGRSAEARLAVANERLRLADELHDVLGHRLSVIAMQAELAGQTEIQGLARQTLQDVRAAVHDYGTIDLPGQLTAAKNVLTTAGIDARLTVESPALSPAASRFLAQAVREAVTNILRHSDATRCELSLTATPTTIELTVRNDNPHPAGDETGTGLAGLADRGTLAGLHVTWERGADEFVLTVTGQRT